MLGKNSALAKPAILAREKCKKLLTKKIDSRKTIIKTGQPNNKKLLKIKNQPQINYTHKVGWAIKKT